MKNSLKAFAFVSLFVLSACSSSVSKPFNKNNIQKPEIWFPEIRDFSLIENDLQSVDPNIYNFQMWTTKNGIYIYAIQTIDKVKTDSTNQWKNTHFECEIWNGDFGYGWSGTYVALFLDDTFYLNNWNNVRGIYYLLSTHSENDVTTLEYYFYIEFPNNALNKDPSYAYIKPYQFMPDITPIKSKLILRDDRYLITGEEKSFQVHDTIDKFMTE